MDTSSIPRTAGIYIITCATNGKFYVGSSVNIGERVTEHIRQLKLGKHQNPKLQNAYNKYGGSVFTIGVLELVMPCSLLDREQHWLNILHPFGERGFNINPVASKPPTRKAQTPQTREKISISHKGIRPSLEARAKMSASKAGKARKLYTVTNPDGEEFEVLGLIPFCLSQRLHSGHMVEVANGTRTHYKGWKCRHADK